jgi:hypothetical protein
VQACMVRWVFGLVPMHGMASLGTAAHAHGAIMQYTASEAWKHDVRAIYGSCLIGRDLGCDFLGLSRWSRMWGFG